MGGDRAVQGSDLTRGRGGPDPRHVDESGAPAMTTLTRGLVLVVDDESSNRYAISRVLIQAGYRVMEAGTGDEALRTMRDERPDLVVLDVRLPDISGYEVCRRIKSDPETA